MKNYLWPNIYIYIQYKWFSTVSSINYYYNKIFTSGWKNNNFDENVSGDNFQHISGGMSQ